ncbi:hypothetical protein KL86DYS2_13458 [uncultured Dysgonomonas sp.]|uniref:Uncharacterized protein n=1 Tax=uncultured Dysgonomonas sp. TaxID=206096 RepID=A0A212KAK2_9BACT|nr:hypothetical protein KL86DYS2_13458 [uncultured Dysgonomonas sp.]
MLCYIFCINIFVFSETMFSFDKNMNIITLKYNERLNIERGHSSIAKGLFHDFFAYKTAFYISYSCPCRV